MYALFCHIAFKMTVMWSYIVLFALTLTPEVKCMALLSLSRLEYHVREGDQVSLDVLKTGTAASTINVVLQVTVCTYVFRL